MVLPVQKITTHQAKTHLSRYLAAVEAGETFLISRGRKPVARLIPVEPAARPARPKAGKIKGAPFEFPVEAFAALSPEELKSWGLR
jgi:prevent-host-death family protein